MPDPNAQVLYGWSGDAEPLSMEVDGAEEKIIRHSDFIRSMSEAEKAFGEKILQDNAGIQEFVKTISDAGLTVLDTGTATTAQIATEVNKIIAILNSYQTGGKNRG